MKFFLCIFLIVFSGLSAAENQEDKTVLLAILARNKAHVLPQYLHCIDKLDYNKSLISVYINTNNNRDQTEEILTNWIQKNQNSYARIIFDKHEIQNAELTKPHEWTASRLRILGKIRNKSLTRAAIYKTDYYFVVDCDNFIMPHTLKDLIAKDKPIIAPMLHAKPVKDDTYSNYFCAVTSSGYFAAHPDFNKIRRREMIGVYEVPVVHCTYLINTDYISKLGYVDGSDDYEFVIFSNMARKNHVKQYICNEKEFGFLLHFNEKLTLEQEQNRVKTINFEEAFNFEEALHCKS